MVKLPRVPHLLKVISMSAEKWKNSLWKGLLKCVFSYKNVLNDFTEVKHSSVMLKTAI